MPAYRKDNLKELRDKEREYSKQKRTTHRDELNAYHRRYTSTPEYKQRDLPRQKAKSHTRRARLAGVGGTFSKQEWQQLLDETGHRCLSCKRTDRKLTIDHIIPISKGGINTIANIQPLCMPCNASKGVRSTNYRMEV
jgi:5-methylcytosine-specific restriction endonuclease McrA